MNAHATRETLQCPECGSTNIKTSPHHMPVINPDRRVCTCQACTYTGRQWRFKQLIPVAITTN